MKKQIELKEYFFENIHITLPPFPGIGKPIKVDSVSRKYSVFFNKKENDRVALRWILDFHSRKQGRSKSTYSVLVSIVGIFKVSSLNSRKENAHLAICSGSPFLYEIIKSEVEKFLLRSLLKPAKLPNVAFEKVKPKKISGNLTRRSRPKDGGQAS